jgi:hypothetical protein
MLFMKIERENLEAFAMVRGKKWRRPEVFVFSPFFFLSLRAGCGTCLTS